MVKHLLLLVLFCVLLVLSVKLFDLHEGVVLGGLIGAVVMIVLGRRTQRQEQSPD
jgi:hypothetical protein